MVGLFALMILPWQKKIKMIANHGKKDDIIMMWLVLIPV
jgi:hypothetical protein